MHRRVFLRQRWPLVGHESSSPTGQSAARKTLAAQRINGRRRGLAGADDHDVARQHGWQRIAGAFQSGTKPRRLIRASALECGAGDVCPWHHAKDRSFRELVGRGMKGCKRRGLAARTDFDVPDGELSMNCHRNNSNLLS